MFAVVPRKRTCPRCVFGWPDTKTQAEDLVTLHLVQMTNALDTGCSCVCKVASISGTTAYVVLLLRNTAVWIGGT